MQTDSLVFRITPLKITQCSGVALLNAHVLFVSPLDFILSYYVIVGFPKAGRRPTSTTVCRARSLISALSADAEISSEIISLTDKPGETVSETASDRCISVGTSLF